MYDSGEDIVLYGKSGASYRGRIYANGSNSTDLSTLTIVCLTNSKLINGQWEHQIKDIYNLDDPQEALNHFYERADISHLIFIPRNRYESCSIDKVADLIQIYIHK